MYLAKKLLFNSIIAIGFGLTFSTNILSQNLVQNHTFDVFIPLCPAGECALCGSHQFGFPGWFNPKAYPFSNGFTGTEIAHDCVTNPFMWGFTGNKPGNFPYPETFEGLGYALLKLMFDCVQTHWLPGEPNPVPIGRSLLTNLLLDTLQAGAEYCVEYYTRPYPWTKTLTKNIGALFSADTISYFIFQQNVGPHIEPQQIISDTTQWTRVKGTYIANGNDRYITFGNFWDDNSSTVINSGFPRS